MSAAVVVIVSPVKSRDLDAECMKMIRYITECKVDIRSHRLRPLNLMENFRVTCGSDVVAGKQKKKVNRSGVSRFLSVVPRIKVKETAIRWSYHLTNGTYRHECVNVT